MITSEIKMKRRKPVECRIRGNKIFFYGKTARLVQRAMDAAGITAEEFLERVIKNQFWLVRESLSRRRGK